MGGSVLLAQRLASTEEKLNALQMQNIELQKKISCDGNALMKCEGHLKQAEKRIVRLKEDLQEKGDSLIALQCEYYSTFVHVEENCFACLDDSA